MSLAALSGNVRAQQEPEEKLLYCCPTLLRCHERKIFRKRITCWKTKTQATNIRQSESNSCGGASSFALIERTAALLFNSTGKVVVFIHTTKCVELHRKSPKIHSNAAPRKIPSRTSRYSLQLLRLSSDDKATGRFIVVFGRTGGKRELPTTVGRRETAARSSPADRDGRLLTKTYLTPSSARRGSHSPTGRYLYAQKKAMSRRGRIALYRPYSVRAGLLQPNSTAKGECGIIEDH